MEAHVKNSSRKNGFTLIEVLIALFVLTISMLGLLTLSITSMQANLQNDIRNTAVRVTTQTAEVLLARPIAALVSCGITSDNSITDANAAAFQAAFTYNAANTCLVDSAAATDFQKYPNPNQLIRGTGVTQTYNVTWTVGTFTTTTDLIQITILVSYRYRGQTYTNTAVIFKHRQA